MKNILAIVYETNPEPNCNVLYVADPNTKLPNGNNKVIKILIGSFADDVYKELTEVHDDV